MKNKEMLRHFADGERSCPICHVPLTAHVTWPGHRDRHCGNPRCIESLKGLVSKTRQFIGLNAHKCEGPGCKNFVAPGLYAHNTVFLTCSEECYFRRRSKGNVLLTCGCGCNQQFLGQAAYKPKNGLDFLDANHRGAYEHRRNIEDKCGEFAGIANEYFDGYARLHYRTITTSSTPVCNFFLYLNESGITSIEHVTPATITAFCSWATDNGQAWLANSISLVSTFFNWAIATGHRNGANPVIPAIHRTRRPGLMPRPLEDEDVTFMWKLLHERGNPRLRLIAAIALESGLRIGEICRIRIMDVHLAHQTIFVRLPNKANKERYAFFSDLTVKYYHEWMEVRNPGCLHDLLLHNERLAPLKVGTVIFEFGRTLCKEYRGEKLHDSGFDKWSTHRLRHTMASNLVSSGADAATVMAAGGWKSFVAMTGYARVSPDIARRGYDEAMRRAKEQKKNVPQRRILTPDELLKRKALKRANQSPNRDLERCV